MGLCTRHCQTCEIALKLANIAQYLRSAFLSYSGNLNVALRIGSAQHKQIFSAPISSRSRCRCINARDSGDLCRVPMCGLMMVLDFLYDASRHNTRRCEYKWSIVRHQDVGDRTVPSRPAGLSHGPHDNFSVSHQGTKGCATPAKAKLRLITPRHHFTAMLTKDVKFFKFLCDLL